jgi:hypothetical protein
MKKSVHTDLGIVRGVPRSKREEIMAFGSVTKVDEGTDLSSRRELYDAGVHRALPIFREAIH